MGKLQTWLHGWDGLFKLGYLLGYNELLYLFNFTLFYLFFYLLFVIKRKEDKVFFHRSSLRCDSLSVSVCSSAQQQVNWSACEASVSMSLWRQLVKIKKTHNDTEASDLSHLSLEDKTKHKHSLLSILDKSKKLYLRPKQTHFCQNSK